MRLPVTLLFVLTLSFAAAAGQPGAPAPLVTVGKVGEAEDVDTKRYTGHITHAASVNLVARVSGELLRMGFREGELVEKGQVLFELDPVRYRANVLSSEAKVKENEARVDYAEISYNRNKSLFEQRATSKDVMDASESEHSAYRAALAASEAELITAKDDLENTVITAPISGKIGVSSFTEGNYLTPSSGVIATIVQVDPLRVNFAMSNRDFLSMFHNEKGLKQNALIRLRLADDSFYEHEGRVDFIDNHANQRTDSIQVYAAFDNPDGRLIPGSTVTVILSRRTGGKSPAVIPTAVMHDAKEAYVYVVDNDNRVERRVVELGPLSNRAQLVRKGLAVGEAVVVDGMHKAMPGMEIRRDPADSAYDIVARADVGPEAAEAR